MAASAERKALYPGSFDPVTNGHVWVMGNVSERFDEGIVAVGYNPNKPGRFPVSDREEMLQEVAVDFPNLVITSFHGLYQADFAEMMGASVIVRGMRTADYNFENDITQINRSINPRVETAFILPPNDLQQISSSMVMGLVGFEGWEEQVKRMVPRTVFDRIESRQKEIDKATLHRRWNELHGRLGAKGDEKVQFENLYERYEESHRSYHATAHIMTCLNELDLVRSQIEDPNALELAIWFHDAVYESSIPQDPEKPVIHDDEGLSAELASKVIREDMGLERELADKVARIVLATKHAGIIENSDAAYMVDIDLAILGRSAKLFDEYEAKIRQEYGWVDQGRFKEARSKVLESFLQRPSVYVTPFFQKRYERQARQNLRRSITALKKSD